MLQRNYEFELIETKDDGGVGNFAGYASTKKVDAQNEQIMGGAFTETLQAKKPGEIKLLWQHDWKKPIGVIDMLEEDRKGLKMTGQLALDVQQGAEAYALMKMGALDGLSIGFRVPDGGRKRGKDGITKINKVDLVEVSVVTFPANASARISTVKSCETIRDWENYLRDEGNLSQSQAKVVAKAVVQSLDHRDVDRERRDLFERSSRLFSELKNEVENVRT